MAQKIVKIGYFGFLVFMTMAAGLLIINKSAKSLIVSELAYALISLTVIVYLLSLNKK